MHRELIKQGNRRIRERDVDRIHHETFWFWFQNYVSHLVFTAITT